MRILFTSHPLSGHLHPLLPVARALVDAGHEVLFALPRSGCAWVEVAGLPVVPLGIDWVDVLQINPEAEAHQNDPSWVLDMVFARLRPQRAMPELLALIEHWQPAVLVRELSEFSAVIASELTDLPHATVEIAAAGPPHLMGVFGPGLAETRAVFGLAPDPQLAALYRYLGLAFYPPSLEVPEGEAVITRHYLRPLVFDRTGPEGLPAWVEELPDCPTVYATLGTVWNSDLRIFTVIIDGLRDEPINLIVTVGRRGDPAAFGPQPPNVRIEHYIPQSLLLPHCQAIIAHGGRGTMLAALSHGLPLVMLPLAADHPANAAQCAALGAARVVTPEALTPAAIRDATRAVLDDPAFHQSAQRVQAQMQALPGPEHAVRLLERLAVERQPIHRAELRRS